MKTRRLVCNELKKTDYERLNKLFKKERKYDKLNKKYFAILKSNN